MSTDTQLTDSNAAPEVPAVIQQPWESAPPAAPTAPDVTAPEAPAAVVAPLVDAPVEKAPEVPAVTAPVEVAPTKTPKDKKAKEPIVEEVKGNTITVFVPKAFELTVDHATTLSIKAGVQEMAPELADHWYSIANGVEVYAK